MGTYNIKATVSVDVEISITAGDKEAALSAFENGISMTASIVEMGDDEYIVIDDGISDIEQLNVEEE